MISEIESLNARTLFEIVARHRRTIVLFPLITMLAGALFFVFFPRTYRSEAKLFLRLGRESVGLDPMATTGQTLRSYSGDRTDEVKSVQDIFKSRSVASQVVDRLGPDEVLGRGIDGGPSNTVANMVTLPLRAFIGLVKSVDPISDREEAIIKIERNLTVGGERQSTVVLVDYDAKSPQLAQKVCKTIIDVAQQEHIRVHRSESSSPFFTEQQQLLRAQLDQSLEALRAAKDELGLADVDERRSTLEAKHSATELDRLKTNQELATAQARVEDLERQLAEVPERLIESERSVPNQGADLLRDRLYELQVRSMDLQARYSESHPLVRAVKEQLEDAKKVLDAQAEQRKETTDAINSVHRELSLVLKQERSMVAGIRSRILELDQQKKGVLADLRALNQHDLKIDQLTRDVDLARGKFMQYARAMEESRIDKELQNEGVSNISVVQPATLAEKPVVPSRALTVAGTLALALAGTVGLVLLGERQNSPLPPVSGIRPNGRRVLGRRIRRDIASRSNGQSKVDEVPTLPK
jgi:uncharacterized protein involved in exopolysaccharide biosynthesis